MSSYDIEKSEFTEENKLCPENVKEPIVISDKSCLVIIYERWNEKSFLFKITIIVSFIIFITAILQLITKGFSIESFFNTEPGELSGSFGSYSYRNYKKTCGEFGCCEIYKNCKISATDEKHIDFEKIIISPKKITGKDTLKTNCPSLESIISMYNIAKNPTNNCGEFGCCPSFDVGCDSILQNQTRKGNNEDLVNDYLKYRIKNVPVRIPKKDEIGSNCWTHYNSGEYHFVYSYENGFYNYDSSEVFVFILIILICLFCTSSKR